MTPPPQKDHPFSRSAPALIPSYAVIPACFLFEGFLPFVAGLWFLSLRGSCFLPGAPLLFFLLATGSPFLHPVFSIFRSPIFFKGGHTVGVRGSLQSFLPRTPPLLLFSPVKRLLLRFCFFVSSFPPPLFVFFSLRGPFFLSFLSPSISGYLIFCFSHQSCVDPLHPL